MVKYFIILSIVLNMSCQPAIKRQEQTEPKHQKVDLLQSLIERSKNENKKIFLVFGFKACGWCKVFNRYHQDPDVKEILCKYFILVMVDIDRSSEEMDLYKNYTSIGFPSWTILDSNKFVLVNSDAQKKGYSIGYPHSERDINYYIDALKKSAPQIQGPECLILREKLVFYRTH